MDTANANANSISLTRGGSAKETEGDLLKIDATMFNECFGRQPFLIRHRIQHEGLFSLPRLIELARCLPEQSVEYNAGEVPISLDPNMVPRTGLSVVETIQRIEERRSWMVLKNVEQDPDYYKLLDRCLDEVARYSYVLDPGMHDREGFIFISSPFSVTPYHIDNEQNFLLQICGKKMMHVFNKFDRSILSEEEIENLMSGAHRNLIFEEKYREKATVFDLKPGDGLHVPVASPHWVKNGNEVSISFSVTFQTAVTKRKCHAYKMNAWLRRQGFMPAPVGQSLLKDAIKSFASQTFRRVRRFTISDRVGKAHMYGQGPRRDGLEH